ncbi:MAG: DUF1800 domain-containing protein [Terracidiphilus sp.]
MDRCRGILAALVCINLLSPSASALAQTAASPANQIPEHASARPPYKSSQLQGDEKILHALNRFTFGPRPGDLEAVRAMGLETWFDRQLHPETLDQTDLDARLTQFPAMQLNPQELLLCLPSNAVIRQAVDGKAPIPPNGALHVVYENEIARYQARQQEKEQKKLEQASADAVMAGGKPAAGSETMAMNAPASADTGVMAQAPQSSPAVPNQMSRMPAESKPDEAHVDPAVIAEILALPPQQRVARLTAMQQPEFDSFRKALKPQQRAALLDGLNPAQQELTAALESPQRLVNDELAYQRLTRDIDSNAQLQEVMTDFWLNHFNVFLHKNEETPYYLVSYERDVIRPRALGKFEDLLEATAHSPAMLLYLDNSSSMGPDSPAAEHAKTAAARHPGKQKTPEGLNENYARELMELHTLGVNGGYTQADVIQVARVLTGWTVDRPQRGGGFKFDENRHEPGDKKVLGQKIKENGEQEGRELLHVLALQPATARFLSRKLAVRFAGDDPPQSLVDRMAKSYLASGGDMAVVLKTLFHSPEFWASGAYRAKMKTPLDYVVSAARASNASIDNLQPLVNALREMGMPLYGAVPPTGYNWQSSAWVSTGALVNRMNFALALAANKLPGIAVSWAPAEDLSAGQTSSASNPGAEERRLESLLVAGGVSESTRAAVLEQFTAQGTQTAAPARPIPAAAKAINPAQAARALERQDQLLAGLLLGSPEFQRR